VPAPEPVGALFDAPFFDWMVLALGGVAVVTTALSLSRAKAWWVRLWDFPRLQIAALAVIAIACWVAAAPIPGGFVVPVAVGSVLAYQGAMIWRYTRLAPTEVQISPVDPPDPARTLALLESNVLQTNRDADRVVRTAAGADADVMLFVEADRWWEERLDRAFAAAYPYALRCPLDNLYGMLLYSRLPLEDGRVEFLVHDDIPSMQAWIRLRGGARVWLNAVHPRPPAPGESDKSLDRDAELLVVGARVREALTDDPALPVVVFGDLNDVAWSHTTRLFQKTSRLLDPRKGRGFFSTFHARWPGLRWPLDHVFFSEHFRLITMRRLDYVGSDHFPVHIVVSLEGAAAAAEQEAPEADRDDLAEARDTIAEARDAAARGEL
jgi:endonuclease/exonuclease/phosphatase (EEP) superfamily protein YafD